VASLSQGRTAAAQCGLFTHKSVPVIFEPPCSLHVVICLDDSFIDDSYIHTGLSMVTSKYVGTRMCVVACTL